MLAASAATVVPSQVNAAPNRSEAESVSETAESRAIAAAKESGFPVEVAGSRSELSRSYATPGGQLVHELYAVPRWARQGDGGWRQVDTGLHRVGEHVVPKATLVDVRFSAGGTKPLLTLSIAGGTFGLTWPAPLPVPVIEGDTAVYRSVFDGVDLRVRALVDGFSWVLVVHSAEAAKNRALDQIRLGLAATGLTTRARADGAFEVLDAAGAPVLTAEKAMMWDAGGSRTGDREVLRSAPDQGRKADIPITVGAADLTITPDPSILRGKTTVYPVVIDPWTTINKTRWGYAHSQNTSRSDGVVRVGLEPGAGIFRSFFSFNLTTLDGKTIRNAKFLTLLKHSWSCTNTPVNLYRTGALTTSGRQTWDGPNLVTHIQERSGHAHKPSTGAGCADDPQPDLPMEFAATKLRDDITAVGRGSSNYTLALSARRADGTGESTTSYWKKFDAAATKLSIEYNTPPNTPTAAQLSEHADYTAPAQGCVSGSGRPVIRSTTPWLKATLTDPDGANGGTLSGQFLLQKWAPGSATWATVSGWPKTRSGVAPNARAEMQVTTGISVGDRLRWQVKTSDTLGGTSGWSPLCEFDVDGTPPATTPSVTAADGLYLESPPAGGNQVPRGGQGRSGQFTFGANGAADVYDYVYQLDGGAESVAKPTQLGGSVTVWVTPASKGDNVLTVRSRDQAGNRSAPYDYVFAVDEASAPTAVWTLDEGTGASAGTTPAGGPAMTLVNGPTWTGGRTLGADQSRGQDWATKLDGVDDHLTAAGPVLDTSRSYSVAAWVRPDAEGWSAPLASAGAMNSSFMLRRWHDNRWAFTVIQSDVFGSAMLHLLGPVGHTGVWAHVAGVYDVAGGQVRLYVNGVLAASGSIPATFNATGPLTVGRERWKGTDMGYVNGAVGEVRVWDRVVFPSWT